jgi:excisionase family DNA binding protein
MPNVPTAQTSPHALALGDQAARAVDQALPREKRKGMKSGRAPRPPPLPPDIAMAYRVNDAAAVLGVCRASIYNLIAANRLRSVMVAGRRLIPADALGELLGTA